MKKPLRILTTAALFVSAVAWSQGGPALPPNHPALGGAASQPPQQGLPHDHPPVGEGQEVGPLREDLRNSVPSADELLQQLAKAKDLEGRDKTFEVASAMSKLFYQAGRYAEATLYFRQTLEKAAPARKDQRRLAAKGRSGEPKSVPPGCLSGPQAKLDEQHALSRELEKTDPAAAFACLSHALLQAEDIRGLLAQSLFLSGKLPDALLELDLLVAENPSNANAYFTRAATRYELAGDDLGALKQSSADFARYLSLEPKGARTPLARALSARIDKAVVAGGLLKLNQAEDAERHAKAKALTVAAAPPQGTGNGMPQLTQEMVDAVQNTERTPELNEGLSKLVEEGEAHLSQGRFEEALDAYKRVVPFQPQNGRAKAGMAWSLVGLGKPSADRIWSVAVESDPKSVDALGDLLKQKGNAKGAKALWAKLAASAPEYARQAGLAQKSQ